MARPKPKNAWMTTIEAARVYFADSLNSLRDVYGNEADEETRVSHVTRAVGPYLVAPSSRSPGMVRARCHYEQQKGSSVERLIVDELYRKDFTSWHEAIVAADAERRLLGNY